MIIQNLPFETENGQTIFIKHYCFNDEYKNILEPLIKLKIQKLAEINEVLRTDYLNPHNDILEQVRTNEIQIKKLYNILYFLNS